MAASCLKLICSILTFSSAYRVLADVQSPYRYPTKCEVCKIFTHELHDRLETSGKNKEVLRLGQGLDESKKKAVDYQRSELRLIEAIHEPHICDEIKKYNVHAERLGSLRYAKGQSETMGVLHGLKNKGVKVELGIPEDMWDSQNAEVGQMMRECYGMLEDHEEDIEEWYRGDQSQNIIDYLCRDVVLEGEDTECLDEVWTGKERTDYDSEKDLKGDPGDKGTAAAADKHTEL